MIWEGFANFLELIPNCWKKKQHAFETYHNLIKLLWFWYSFRKDKGILFMGHQHIPLSFIS